MNTKNEIIRVEMIKKMINFFYNMNESFAD